MKYVKHNSDAVSVAHFVVKISVTALRDINDENNPSAEFEIIEHRGPEQDQVEWLKGLMEQQLASIWPKAEIVSTCRRFVRATATGRPIGPDDAAAFSTSLEVDCPYGSNDNAKLQEAFEGSLANSAEITARWKPTLSVLATQASDCAGNFTEGAPLP